MQVPELTASHVFSFWEGIPTEARCALGRLVAASPAVQVTFCITYKGSFDKIKRKQASARDQACHRLLTAAVLSPCISPLDLKSYWHLSNEPPCCYMMLGQEAAVADKTSKARRLRSGVCRGWQCVSGLCEAVTQSR